MCIAIPAKVVEIVSDELILVDFGGVKREIKSTLLDDKIEINDYVLVHIGFAMAKVDEEDALETLKLFAEIEACTQSLDSSIKQE
ncbi:MAG: HypC/HybG/HupF family hydrogenase formation chaperone [Candidatus Heimdallarchaeota archaeon]